MPTTGAQGTNSRLGLKKAATWRTAVAPTTSDRAPFVSANVQKIVEQIPDDSLLEKGTRAISSNGAERIEGDTAWLGDYRQPVHLLAAALILGTAGVPTLVETGVYKHVLKFRKDTDGLFATMDVDFGGKDVHRFKSVKPTRRVVRVQAADRMVETFTWLGAGLDATASFGATYLHDPNGNGARRILASKGVIRVNAHAAGALGAGDRVYPRLIEIDINRNLQGDYPVGQAEMEEPIRSDFDDVRVTLEFQSMTAEVLALFRDNRDTDTPLKMDAVFTHGTLLGSTKYRERSWYFPKLKVLEVPTDIPGPGLMPVRVVMSAHYSDIVPTGFPATYQQEVVEEWQNELSADPLA